MEVGLTVRGRGRVTGIHRDHARRVADGDRLLVSELSSLGQVIQIVDTLVHRKIRFIAIKEGIELDGKQDLQTKVMIALFELFAGRLVSHRDRVGSVRSADVGAMARLRKLICVLQALSRHWNSSSSQNDTGVTLKSTRLVWFWCDTIK